MNSSMPNPVDRISTTTGLSTVDVIPGKLFIVSSMIKSHLQSGFLFLEQAKLTIPKVIGASSTLGIYH